MLHYDEINEFYELIGETFNLYAFTLEDLKKQALELYQIDVLTILN